ncbi:hypothetical protein FHS14_004972 [Paenibacillus baekrokdamisoli]|nr:hypothetical protein [Paenibacillus baekrokdamisoli]
MHAREVAGDFEDDPQAYMVTEGGITEYRKQMSTLYAVTSDRKIKWQLELEGLGALEEPVLISPWGDLVLGRDALYVVDKGGKLKWTSSAFYDGNSGVPAIYDGQIYMPIGNRLHVFGPDGEMSMESHVGGIAEGLTRDSIGNVYLWGRGNAILALNPDGSEKWRHVASGVPAASIVGTDSGIMYSAYYSDRGQSKIIAFTDPYAKILPAPQPPQRPLEIVVTLDGVPMHLAKAPLLSQGYVFVPIRELFTRLGAAVSFDAKKKIIIARKGDTTMMYRLSDAYATINGNQVRMEAGYRTWNSQVYMPLRFVSEVFGYKVVYDASLYVVKITTW